MVAAVELVDVLGDGVQRAVAARHRARARADDLHQQRLRLVRELLQRAQERLGGRAHALRGVERPTLRSPAARIAPRITSIAVSNKETMQSSLLSKCS